MDHRDPGARHLDRASLVHADRLDPVRPEPDTHLMGSDRGGAVDTSQLDEIHAILTDMIEMTMRGSDHIDLLRCAVCLGIVRCAAPSIDPDPGVAR
jgi:hypothetical protein